MPYPMFSAPSFPLHQQFRFSLHTLVTSDHLSRNPPYTMDTSTENADGELENRFKDAVRKYCEVTGISIVVDTPFTVEDMEREISQLESNATNKRWNEKARLTLDILMRMGEFGAEAASAVSCVP